MKSEKPTDEVKSNKTIIERPGQVSKLQLISSWVLAFATTVLCLSTIAYAVITGFTLDEMRANRCYTSSQRILSMEWDEYKYDRDVLINNVSNEGNAVLNKDLNTIYNELWEGEDELRNYSGIDDKQYSRISNAISDFWRDYNNNQKNTVK